MGKLWNLRKTKLFVETRGDSNKPVLLVVHGGPGGNHLKLLPLSRFSSKFHVVFYDQRGSGESKRFKVNPHNPKTFSPLTLEENIEDIEAIRKRLHANKISIIGHSWGGALVTFYAAKYPSHVEKLIVYSGGPEDLNLIAQKEKNLSSMINANKNRLLALKAKKLENAVLKNKVQTHLDKLFLEIVGIVYPALFHNKRNSRSKLGGKAGFWANQIAGSYSEQFERAKFSKKLKKVKAPTLLIWGRHEPSPIERLLYLLENIKNSRMVVFEKSGHNAMEEEPELFFRTLKGFLNGQELSTRYFKTRSEFQKKAKGPSR